jgi:hypothetical protein
MSEHQQAMLERMQMLEEALRRGISGTATTDDWKLIFAECGMPTASFFKPETRSDK